MVRRFAHNRGHRRDRSVIACALRHDVLHLDRHLRVHPPRRWQPRANAAFAVK